MSVFDNPNITKQDALNEAFQVFTKQIIVTYLKDYIRVTLKTYKDNDPEIRFKHWDVRLNDTATLNAILCYMQNDIDLKKCPFELVNFQFAIKELDI